jgi:hypothetical protein
VDDIWQERRAPRRGWGGFWLVLFILFNVVMIVDLVTMLADARAIIRAEPSGLAILAVRSVITSRLIEHAVLWAGIGGALGLLVMATRGAREMVRVTRAPALTPPAIPRVTRSSVPEHEGVAMRALGALALLIVAPIGIGIYLGDQTLSPSAAPTPASVAEAVSVRVTGHTLSRHAYACATEDQTRALTSAFGPGRQEAWAGAVLGAIARRECRNYARGTSLVVRTRAGDAIAEVWEAGTEETWYMAPEFLVPAVAPPEPTSPALGARLETATIPKASTKPERVKLDNAHAFACRAEAEMRLLLKIYDPAVPARWVGPLSAALDAGRCTLVPDGRWLRVLARAEGHLAQVRDRRATHDNGVWWTAAEVVSDR